MFAKTKVCRGYCVAENTETAVYGPAKMIVIPPRHFIVIKNPVKRDENHAVVKDRFGRWKKRYNDL
jgi:major vault protein